MDNNEILEKAKELGKMIAECETCKNMKEAEAAQLSDENAQKMMYEYNLKCEEFSKRANNPDITKEEFDKIQMDAQAEFVKLCQNDNIKNYLEANRAFGDLINQVNNIIAYFVKGEEESGCSGNCSGCHGCH